MTATTPDDGEKLFITLRDVYDSVRNLEAKLDDRLDRHEAADSSRFDSLNLKFYGVLGAIGAAAIAVLVQLSGAHL